MRCLVIGKPLFYQCTRYIVTQAKAFHNMPYISVRGIGAGLGLLTAVALYQWKFFDRQPVGKYQLFYFPIRGRAQAIRYLFVDNGIEFEEINIEDEWTTKYKSKMPFGQVPVVKDGDLDVAQSHTILRYLGRKHDLYPTDLVEAMRVDMITDHIEDIRGPYVTMIYDNYENGKEGYIQFMHEKLQYIENLFKTWRTDFISSKLSSADYNLFALLDDLVILSPTCLDTFPTLKAYYDRIASRSTLKTYRESEIFKNLPVNGNGKQ